MIGIIDYGLGNIHSFLNIYHRLGISAKPIKKAEDLSTVTHIILPGVGAFDWAMNKLYNSGMSAALVYSALVEKRPVLGVCVGMQIMARSSEEGVSEGLGWFDAEVRYFDKSKIQINSYLPHMGWNDVEPINNYGLFRGLSGNSRFYFLHSYYFSPRNQGDILATSVYGDRFACAIQKDNLYGVQFHPEKSHASGVELLKNFASI